MEDQKLGPCAKQVVTCTLAHPDGRRWVGRNDVEHPQAVCPRGNSPSEVGYELCHSVCGQRGHAEEQALRLAGKDAWGCTAYVEGIHYICANCQVMLVKAGVNRMVLGMPVDDAFLRMVSSIQHLNKVADAILSIEVPQQNIDTQLAAARAAEGLMLELVKLWDSETISSDNYNEAIYALEQRIRALATQAAPTQAAPTDKVVNGMQCDKSGLLCGATNCCPRVSEQDERALYGFDRDDLDAIADGLEASYEKSIDVGGSPLEGIEKNLIESTTTAAARFIRASLAHSAQAAPKYRFEFLHSTNKDADGWEWGVARVRVGDDGKVEFLWGLSDHSDIDTAMAAQGFTNSAQAAQGSGVQAEPLFDPTTLTRYAPDRDGNMAAAYDGMYVTLSDVQDVAYAASPAPSAAPAMEDVRAMAEFIVNHAVADHTDTNGPDWHACACCAAEIPINGSTYQNLTLEHKDDCLFVKARAYLAAPAQVAQCKPVARVVSRIGNDLRVGWLRPELCDVGTLLYAGPPKPEGD